MEEKIENTIDRDGQIVSGREYKIEYQLNQLSSMSTEDGDIIKAIAESDEVELFLTDAVVDLIDYRWK